MCTACQNAAFNSKLADAFAGRMLEVLNSAGLALMISLGHRTGLFDAMGDGAATTSVQLAERTSLNERYVREWLGAMTVGEIVAYDPEQKTYSLPAEHAAFLTRAASPNNVATSMQWFSVLGTVESQIVDCFQHGGGVPYSAFPRFNEVMAEESAQTVVAGLLEHIVPLIPEGRRRLEEGIKVLDVGCGSGRALMVLAEAFPNSRFTGYDFLPDAVEVANRQAAEKGLTNISFEAKDISNLDGATTFDLITSFDVIHDQAKPAETLQSIRRSLKPDGIYLMQDIRASSRLEKNRDHILGPFLYTISCMHCMTVSLALGGAGLGTVWGAELALQMLQEAGFGPVQVTQLPHDILNSYYVAKAAPIAA